MNRPMRDAYGDALVKLGARNPHVVVLDGDLGNSTRADQFGEHFPDRFFQVGIAEQNMMGIAAGLAASGLIPVVNSFAVFATCRAYDQIRTSVAQPRLGVKITGSYSGLLASKGGCTHTAVEDIAIMRALPGMTVIAPGDALEAELATLALAELEGPVYMRLTRGVAPPILPEGARFTFGKGVTLRPGNDVALITTGSMTGRALQAAESLSRAGIEAEVLHLSTIKPLDVEAVVAAASRCRLVVTAEEHSILGGLGSAVTEVLSEHHPTRVIRAGIMDRFGESGSDEALLAAYGVDADGIRDRVLQGLQLPGRR